MIKWVCKFCGVSKDSGMVHVVKDGIHTYFCGECYLKNIGVKKGER